MFREFFYAPARLDCIVAWVGLLTVFANAGLNAYISYAINTWYSSFYDLLQTSGAGLLANGTTSELASSESLAESRAKVAHELVVFLKIVLPIVVLSPIARWIRSHWALRWRLCLMRSYMDAWDPNRPPIEGASQRLHEDTQRFGKGVDMYLSVILKATMTLAAFTPILLSLGQKIPPYGGLALLGHSWLFACALLAAILGLGVAMLVGRKLVGLEVQNQKVEAELRRELVLLEASPETICDADGGSGSIGGGGLGGGGRGGGEGGEATLRPPAPYFRRLWVSLADNYSALFRNFLGLNMWLDSFDQVMILAPYVLVAPRLFAALPAERITLGTLMQASNSFDKVFASLSILSEHWGGINEWRSTVVRLRQFEAEQRDQVSAIPSAISLHRLDRVHSNGSDNGDSNSENGGGTTGPLLKGASNGSQRI